MSALDQVCEEFASSNETLSPKDRMTKRSCRASAPGTTKSAMAAMPERERPAISDADPDGDTPAAQPSATAEVPKRSRRANVPVTPILPAPADQPSASGGADEAKIGSHSIAAASRRQNSRAAESGASPAPIRTALKPCTAVSEPDQFTNDAGQRSQVSHRSLARVRRADLTSIDNQRPGVCAAPLADLDGSSVEGNDRAHREVELPLAVSPVVAEIIALYRLRIQWLKAELRQVLQAQAICRQWTDGDKEKAGKLYRQFVDGKVEDAALSAELAIALTPFLEGMRPYREQGALYEKRLAKAAKTLPAWTWAEQVWGFSAYGLAKIVGEAGDVGSYRNPSCLWKRLGLAVFDGKRQRRVTDAEEAALHGYSPQRRSMMWNIGNGLIGGMGLGVRPAVAEDWQARKDWSSYQKIYVGRLLYEAERDPENMAREPTKLGKMSFSKHAHNRAKRYVEKRALRDLWSAWRAAERGQSNIDSHLENASLGSPTPQLMAAE